MPEKLPHRKAALRKPAFALILAISLMSFTLLLLLTLTSLVQVQLSTQSVQKQIATARQNAILGLNSALGKLQQQLGPDQRVSASGMLYKQAGGASNRPMLEDDDPRRHWLGVWDSSQTDDMRWVRDPNAKHIGWLVSGFDTEQHANTMPEINTDIGINGQPADESVALLVGPNTVIKEQEEDYVFAQKVHINDTQGYSNSYAYWIADEAQKAPLNLIDERYADTTNGRPIDQNHLLAPERVGINANTSWHDYNLENESLAKNLDRLLFVDDLEHVEDWGARLPQYYHDFGLSAINLQVDTRNGGLKKDLNLLFELPDADFNRSPFGGSPNLSRLDNPPTDGNGYIDAYVNGPVSYLFKEPVSDKGGSAFLRGPTWHFLRSYYKLWEDVELRSASPTIASRSYRPNTEDYTPIDGQNGMRWGYINVMDSTRSGDVETHNNFINTAVVPRHEWDISGHQISVPRLTAHEVAPVVARTFIIVSFVHVMPRDLDGRPGSSFRIARDQDGNGIQFQYPDSGGAMVDSGYQWMLTDSGYPGPIVALKLQPVVVLWNPYNTSISFEAYKLLFSSPRIALDISWDEPLGPTNPTRGYRATLKDILEIATPRYDANRNQINYNLGNMELILRDENGPITLNPGEQRIFSAYDTKHAADIRAYNDPLFLRSGWDTDGGILCYRLSHPEANRRKFLYPDDNNSDHFWPDATEFDNIPAAHNVTINDVYWVDTALGHEVEYANWRSPNDDSIRNQRWYDFLLFDEDSIERGGDWLSEDQILRSLGGAFIPEEGDGVQDAFSSIRGQTLTPFDIAQGYPFMAIEVRLNPANTDQGIPMEMLGSSNPFAYLASSKHGGNTTPERYSVNIHAMAGSQTYNMLRPETSPSGNRTFFGYSYSFTDGSDSVVLQEVPTAPLWSLGSLQHANISRSSFQPRNAIGNSQASPYVQSSDLDLNHQWGDWESLRPTIGDISYMSNDALFDSYFFSSLAPKIHIGPGRDETSLTQRIDNMIQDAENNGTAPQLPNQRFVYLGDNDYTTLRSSLLEADPNTDDGYGYLKTAAYWAPEGGFNINSTSFNAWKAFLASGFGREFYYYDGQSFVTAQSNGSLFSRFGLPNSNTGSASDKKDDWHAPVDITDAQMDALANAMVDEVIERGPFLSVADFVNRRPGSLVDSQQKQGAIARAIDRSRINESLRQAGYDVSEFSLEDDLFEENIIGSTAAGITGWLTQADVLTPLAPYISARSDTFVIRSYGEVKSNFDGTVSRAWCEAIVQRMPEYVDPEENNAWDDPQALTPDSTNDRFGRRFKIMSFRWLQEDDV